jgi:1-acyl-sn-glycerol-3-phosphate acyltransferase
LVGCYTSQGIRMSVNRHHIAIEFLEKVCAGLCVALPTPFSGVALLSLASRRLRWRRSIPVQEQNRTLAFREVCLLLALTLAAIAAPALQLLPFPPEVTCALLLILTLGAMFLGESDSTALLPRPTAEDFRGPRLANLAGWLLLSVSATVYWRGLDPREGLVFLLCALATSLLPVWMAQRNGEPGMLIPAAFFYLLGMLLGWPALAGLGAGVLPATLVWFTYHVRADFPTRGLLAALASFGAFFLPRWAAPASALILLLLTLQTWRFWLRFAVLALLRVVHRFRIRGEENIPYEGPAMLISNHFTMIDGWLLAGLTQRFVRFLVYDGYYQSPVMRFGLDLFRSIPVSQGARRDAVESLRRARAEIIDPGHVAGLFPEGGISRAGYLQPFQKGFTRILHGSSAPIVPAYLNGLWTNFLSFGESEVGMKFGRFFRPLEIEFGRPMPPTTTPLELWRQVKHLEVNAAYRDSQTDPILPVAFLAAARRYGKLPAIVTPEGVITYNGLATRSQLLARYLRRHLREKSRVGVRLAPGPEKVIAYLALALAGHVAFDLEGETADLGVAATVATEGGIRVDRFLAEPDFRDSARLWLLRLLSPHRAWREGCKFAMRKESAVAVSNSPRGRVVLSHRSVASAAASIRRTLWLKPGVVIRSELPFSRTAGLQLGLWAPLLHGAALHFGPGEADFEVKDAADAEQSQAKYVLAVESESGPRMTAEGERFLPVLELPESSGLLSLSAPPVTFAGETQSATKAGTLGKLNFGLEFKDGQMRGPARFLRYLGEEEKASPALKNEWVVLPETLRLNEQGFVEFATSSSQTS